MSRFNGLLIRRKWRQIATIPGKASIGSGPASLQKVSPACFLNRAQESKQRANQTADSIYWFKLTHSLMPSGAYLESMRDCTNRRDNVDLVPRVVGGRVTRPLRHRPSSAATLRCPRRSFRHARGVCAEKHPNCGINMFLPILRSQMAAQP
jgi:hypothetical protein